MNSNDTQNQSAYVKGVSLENYGPCKDMVYNFRFDEKGHPVPLIIIGKNGSGKSIFLSHIINALLTAKQMIYDNCEVEKGKVYKLRSPNYISSGSLYSKSKVEFTNENANVSEWILADNKESLIKNHNFSSNDTEWAKIPDSENTHFSTTLTLDTAKKLIQNACVQYFPANRFEEPAWLNIHNLTTTVEYMDLENISRMSNGTMVSLSTLKESQKWLLDILFDRSTLELQVTSANLPIAVLKQNNIQEIMNMPASLMSGYRGQASLIYAEILKLLDLLFGVPQGTLRFGLGDRRSRKFSIMRNEQAWIPNLFQLSSGESSLLNLFLCIIRDFDLSNSNFSSLADVSGIVLIDEIDLHLHVNLQKEILPQLIELFPKVQFIIATHSPVFLLGMQGTFGSDGFDIIEMPNADSISVENFTEFQDIFTAIRETKTYTDSINAALQEAQLPTVFVEGDYDIKYITKTIELFYSDKNLLESFKFYDGEGFGNLDKIWKSMDSKVVENLTVETLLLYDCDTSKPDTKKGKVSRRTMPTNPDNIINKGIENLMSCTTVLKLQKANEKFIDITAATSKIQRGITTEVPELKEVNKDEKKNICDWLCKNGEPSDFEGFKVAVDIIIDFLGLNDDIS